MLDLINTISSTPIPTILIVFGAVFIFFAIGGKVGANIVSDHISKSLSGAIGLIFIISGIGFYGFGQLSTNKIFKEDKTEINDKFIINKFTEKIGSPVKESVQIEFSYVRHNEINKSPI